MLGGQKGKPWKDFESLLDFAIAKEMTIQSEKKKKKKQPTPGIAAVTRPYAQEVGH